ncbi:glycoside hydrolase family 9 protein [Nibricoccus sp. IMCC34717]|uniref:glycoside hydrolase family 9 protein n=1 Tax=Nibricoccus sp. IMCC34717 TaxID=3034021 RepID=UPI003850A426
MPRLLSPLLGIVALSIILSQARAETWVRFNQAGYHPDRPKEVVVMSEDNLAGQEWALVNKTNGQVVASGKLGESEMGPGPHTFARYNARVALPDKLDVGHYQFGSEVPGLSAQLKVEADPYRELRLKPLLHLRMLRSGSDDVPGRKRSHSGDARALVRVPDGEVSLGRWKDNATPLTVDVEGGWYDAGDQIKFTLNHAYVVMHLLVAHDILEARGLLDGDGRKRVLDEVRHGLRYLLKLHPQRDLFIIQVGDALDHAQSERLPENDALDGKRPALCALSRTHMAATAAALARGARVMRAGGDGVLATQCEAMALKLFARCLDADTVSSAFERDKVNDFYHDQTESDQFSLAAAELHALTGDADYLEKARGRLPGPGDEVGWQDWNWLANAMLAAHAPAAAGDLRVEVGMYLDRAAKSGRPWGLPSRYVWASLHRWIGAANAAAFPAEADFRRAEREAFRWGVVDYVFGRNNWGVSFLFSESLPNSVRNLYSPMYRMLGRFPEGALSEGPGDRGTHAKLEPFFQTDPQAWTHRFNTSAAVFFDSPRDFMCQEATMGGQADALLLLALASPTQ